MLESMASSLIVYLKYTTNIMSNTLCTAYFLSCSSVEQMHVYGSLHGSNSQTGVDCVADNVNRVPSGVF